MGVPRPSPSIRLNSSGPWECRSTTFEIQSWKKTLAHFRDSLALDSWNTFAREILFVHRRVLLPQNEDQQKKSPSYILPGNHLKLLSNLNLYQHFYSPPIFVKKDDSNLRFEQSRDHVQLCQRHSACWMWRCYISFCFWEDQIYRKHHDISGTIWEALLESENSSCWEPSEYHWQSNPDVWPCLDRLCWEPTNTDLELSPASSWPWPLFAFPWWAGEELVIMEPLICE